MDLRVERGEWVRVHRGVFRDASHSDTWHGKLVAAVLAAGDGTAVSHRAAVGVWGLYGYRPFLVEISVPSPAGRRISGAIVHRRPDLRRNEVARKDGITTTKPARTLLDLAAVARPQFVTQVLEEWLADRVVTLGEIEHAIEDHRGKGRRGVGVLQRLMKERGLDGAADSGTEALLATVLKAHGLPLPVHHYEVTPDGTTYELDYAYPDHKVAIEVDGYGVHMRSRDAFEHDRHRQNEIEIAGWRFLRFTKPALTGRAATSAGQVARMLAA